MGFFERFRDEQSAANKIDELSERAELESVRSAMSKKERKKADLRDALPEDLNSFVSYEPKSDVSEVWRKGEKKENPLSRAKTSASEAFKATIEKSKKAKSERKTNKEAQKNLKEEKRLALEEIKNRFPGEKFSNDEIEQMKENIVSEKRSKRAELEDKKAQQETEQQKYIDEEFEKRFESGSVSPEEEKVIKENLKNEYIESNTPEFTVVGKAVDSLKDKRLSPEVKKDIEDFSESMRMAMDKEEATLYKAEQQKIEDWVNHQFDKRKGELGKLTPEQERIIKENIRKSYISDADKARTEIHDFKKNKAQKETESEFNKKALAVEKELSELGEQEKVLKIAEARLASGVARPEEIEKEKKEIESKRRAIEERKSVLNSGRIERKEAESYGLTLEEWKKIKEKGYKQKDKLDEIERVKRERGYTELEKERGGLETAAFLVPETSVEADIKRQKAIESAGAEGRKVMIENLLSTSIKHFNLPADTSIQKLTELVDSGEIDLNEIKDKLIDKTKGERAEEEARVEKERKEKEKAIAGLNLNAGEEPAARAPGSPAPAPEAVHGEHPSAHHPTETGKKEAKKPEYEFEYVFEDDKNKKTFYDIIDDEFKKLGMPEGGKIRDIVDFYLKAKDKKLRQVREKMRAEGRLKPGMTDEQIIRAFRKELSLQGAKYKPTGEKTLGTKFKQFVFGKKYPETKQKIEELETLEASDKEEVRSAIQKIESKMFSEEENVDVNKLFKDLKDHIARDQGVPEDQMDRAAEVVDLTINK